MKKIRVFAIIISLSIFIGVSGCSNSEVEGSKVTTSYQRELQTTRDYEKELEEVNSMISEMENTGTPGSLITEAPPTTSEEYDPIYISLSDDVFYIDASLAGISFSEWKTKFRSDPEVKEWEWSDEYDTYFYYGYKDSECYFFFYQDGLKRISNQIYSDDIKTIKDKYVGVYGACKSEYINDKFSDGEEEVLEEYCWEFEQCTLFLRYIPHHYGRGIIAADYEFKNNDAGRYQHVLLTNLKPWTYTGGRSFNGSGTLTERANVEDIFGNKYQIAFITQENKSNGERSQTYRLDGQYNTLDFTIAISDLSTRGKVGNGSIYVIGDGRLLFSRTDITAEFESEYVSIDISGIKDLTIEMYGSRNLDYQYTLYLMMCDPYLSNS